MTLELVYTSAPRGVKPGSSGFCTVAMTEGLPRPVAEFLEGLSNAYAHLHMPYDRDAGQNPVSVSLVKARVGGQAVTVLSRNSAAGVDHTGRSNNLAHHLVVNQRDRESAQNPAWAAAQPGVFQTNWEGEPRMLRPRVLPTGRGPTGPCKGWQQAAGDAGWAGVVAEAWESGGTQPLYLVYPAGTDILPLIAEALSLLPPERRWDATFTTYYSGLPAGVTCVVRGVVAGSDQETAARRAAHLDLTTLADQPPPAGRLAQAARSGAAVRTVESQVGTPRASSTQGYRMTDDEAAPPPILNRAQGTGPPVQHVRRDTRDLSAEAYERLRRRQTMSYIAVAATLLVGLALLAGLLYVVSQLSALRAELDSRAKQEIVTAELGKLQEDVKKAGGVVGKIDSRVDGIDTRSQRLEADSIETKKILTEHGKGIAELKKGSESKKAGPEQAPATGEQKASNIETLEKEYARRFEKAKTEILEQTRADILKQQISSAIEILGLKLETDVIEMRNVRSKETKLDDVISDLENQVGKYQSKMIGEIDKFKQVIVDTSNISPHAKKSLVNAVERFRTQFSDDIGKLKAFKTDSRGSLASQLQARVDPLREGLRAEVGKLKLELESIKFDTSSLRDGSP